ncbi:MAG: UDP-2,3-diacylglucosamine diphosphatase [Chitinophagales bacterium]
MLQNDYIYRIKREIDIVVLSDLHLGSNACRAGRLNRYLKPIAPKKVILNGDIIDIWLLDLKKWPKKHTKILAHFFNWMINDIPIYYITGNHDDTLRKFTGLKFHNFKLLDELVLDLDGKKTWILHGDKFDKSVSGKQRKLAIRAGKAFDQFVRFNRFVNEWERFVGRKETNFSKTLKDKTKKSIKQKNDFEQQYIDYASKNGIDAVVCGHVHNPGIWQMVATENRKEITYLNSGDWTESCTALEYKEGKWELFRHKKSKNIQNSILGQVRFDAEEDLP